MVMGSKVCGLPTQGLKGHSCFRVWRGSGGEDHRQQAKGRDI